MGVEPTSDLQGFRLEASDVPETGQTDFYLVCTECKVVVENWRCDYLNLTDLIAVATEHKRADLERKWVKTDG